jgi:hypothetical protein
MNTLLANQSTSVAGLTTSTFTALTANTFMVLVETTLVAPTGVQLVINHNGSPIETSAVASTGASSIGLGAQIACAIGDTISVVLSSSVVNDSIANNVKSNIVITQLSY